MTEFLKLLENNSSDPPHKSSKLSKPALALLCITGGTATAITVLSLPFIAPAFRRVCLPYVPASQNQLVNVLMALKGRSGNLVDLGSGDGRIVHVAGMMGFNAVGVELNYCLVLYSRCLSLWRGVWKNTCFYRANLWTYNLKPFSNVVIFGTENTMPKIEKKILRELNDNSVIVACRFPLPNLKPIEVFGEGIDTVWKYQIVKKMNKS